MPDVEKSQDYWDGYADGADHATKEAHHRFSQWLLNVQRERNSNMLRIALDEKQREISGRG